MKIAAGRRPLSLALLTLALVLVPMGAGAQAATSQQADAENGADVDNTNLSTSEVKLLDSGSPVRVTVDIDSGLPVDVEPLSPAEASQLEAAAGAAVPLTAYPNGCTAGRGCWYGRVLPVGPPSPNIGFTNSNTTTGTWPNRGDFWVPSGTKASVCWGSGPSCTDRLYGPSVYISFGGGTLGVTGKSVTMALVA